METGLQTGEGTAVTNSMKALKEVIDEIITV